MGAVPQQIPSAVPSAVTGGNSVAVNKQPQRRPYQPMTGKSRVPYVPGGEAGPETPWQPAYGTAGTTGETLADGSPGAPSLPVNGYLWVPGPADPHYMVPSARDPYGKVNNPPTRGMTTLIKAFMNHVFNGKQNVDNAGWQQGSPQQRTSYMRVTPPSLGSGFAPATSAPHLNPQQPRSYRFNPTTGTDLPGMVPGQAPILNSATYGAGQTAGGVGGGMYAPPVPPPDTSPVAPAAPSGMPTWG